MIQKRYGKKREKKESPPKKNESRLQVSANGREAKMPWAELGPASQPDPFLQNSAWGEVRPAQLLRPTRANYDRGPAHSNPQLQNHTWASHVVHCPTRPIPAQQ